MLGSNPTRKLRRKEHNEETTTKQTAGFEEEELLKNSIMNIDIKPPKGYVSYPQSFKIETIRT